MYHITEIYHLNFQREGEGKVRKGSGELNVNPPFQRFYKLFLATFMFSLPALRTKALGAGLPELCLVFNNNAIKKLD